MSRAERLFPFAERYIALVRERKRLSSRARLLDTEAAEALRAYEAAEAAEVSVVVKEESEKVPLRRPSARRAPPASTHPWNGRAVPGK